MKIIWSPIEFVEPYTFGQAMEILNDAKRRDILLPTAEMLEDNERDIKFIFNAIDACSNKLVWSDIENVDFVFLPKYIKGTFICPTTRYD